MHPALPVIALTVFIAGAALAPPVQAEDARVKTMLDAKGLKYEREIFSPAGRVEKDHISDAKAKELLAESRLNKLGSWELGGDILYFVIKVPDTLSADQLQSAMDIAAQTADDMEIKLSGDRDDL